MQHFKPYRVLCDRFMFLLLQTLYMMFIPPSHIYSFIPTVFTDCPHTLKAQRKCFPVIRINLPFIVIIALHLSSLPKDSELLDGDLALPIFHCSGKHNKTKTKSHAMLREMTHIKKVKEKIYLRLINTSLRSVIFLFHYYEKERS